MHRRHFISSCLIGGAAAVLPSGLRAQPRRRRELRITRIVVQPARGRRATPVAPNAYAGYRGYDRTEPVLRIQTAQGIEGIGHGVGTPAQLSALLGRDPFELFTWEPGDRIIGRAGPDASTLEQLGGADIALLDLLGRALARPILSLLGNPVRDAVPVYNSCVYMEDLLTAEQCAGLAYLDGVTAVDPVERVARKAAWVLRRPEGFHAVKIRSRNRTRRTGARAADTRIKGLTHESILRPPMPSRRCTLLLLAAFGVLSPAILRSAPGARFVATPPTDRRNDHYVSNRAPLAPTPLVPLPLKAITPRGWLRKQLELQADGFHGHFEEISKYLARENNSWLDRNGQGDHGWEEVPYWLKGFAHNAYLLGRMDQIEKAQVWIEGALSSRQPDGWFGPQKAKSTVKSVAEGERDLWPNMIMLFALQSYYDYSGDNRVLDLMTAYATWQLAYLRSRPDRGADRSNMPFSRWQQQRAGDALWNAYWLYNRTGDPSLLELARELHDWSADWDHGIACAHNVNITESFDTPAIYGQQSHAPEQLAAAERNWTWLRAEYGQVPGGLFGADEQYRPGFTGPRQAIETCGIVEEMLSDEQLLQIAGNPVWAERAETVAFNTLPAAVMADFRGLRYLTAPNQPLSDGASKAPGIGNGGAMFLMSPSRYRCCQHNFGHGWPYFASSTWFATSDNGLAAVFYSEGEVKAKVGDRGTEVKVVAATHYPFEENVTLALTLGRDTRFPLYLRVPAWCRAPVVTVNGQAVSIDRAAGPGFLVLERRWSDGDRVAITLPMAIAVRHWEKNGDSVSVERGPLTFSLQIQEEYRRAGGTDRWPSFEIWPASAWNYGLVLDPEREAHSFVVETRPWPANDMPFTHEGAPLVLKAKGRRIPQWKLDEHGLIEEVQASPALTTEPVEAITLIPMGAARLRLSAFPVADDSPEGHAWK